MNMVQIKESICYDNRIEEILDKLGCHNIKAEQGGQIITAALPDGDNSRSVQIKNRPFLDACIRSKGITDIDIFDVVSYIKFKEETKDDMAYSRDMSIGWVKQQLDLKLTEYNPLTSGWVPPKKKVLEHTILDNKILNKFIMLPHQLWLNEGINYDTQQKFNIGYYLEHNQIIIPIYNKNNELIGVKARNLDTQKYEYKYTYIHPCIASNNLYGLHLAKEYIKKNNKVILFEAEKSVMKAYQYGCKSTVSLGCSDLTRNQLSLLTEYINEETTIILALDHDVYYKDGKYDFSHLREIDKMFKQDVYAVIDKNNLTGEKDAPVDCGREIFIKLIKQVVLIKNLKDDEEKENV